MAKPITITPSLNDQIVSVSEAQPWIMAWESPVEAQVFRISYMDLDLLAESLRDVSERSGAAIHLDATDLRILATDFPDLVESLTTGIHNALEDAGVPDDPEARAEAFDAHAWAPLREALWAAEPRIRGADCLRIEARSGDALGSIDALTGWRISGDGNAPETYEDEAALAQDVARRLAAGGLSVRLISLEHVIEVEDIDSLCEALTETIADDIPSIEEEDARDDDFDNHPLCPIRDALVDVSPNFGGNAPDL